MAKAKRKTKSASKRQTRTKQKTAGTRASSKQAKRIEMLKRTEGATIDEIVKKLE